ncbi:MAG: undecaprenyl-phosphate glucose phosphotransferase [Winogradskyella sp.]|nr:undecaprenyl-phosphate glucose phosphotransferase [Winogradskyella sp.]NNC44666.1 undecaprenyl-phosphate glucose phosphotransferase [Winogradskyella sp.]
MKKGRYSYLIRPSLYVLDLMIISLLSYFFLTTNAFNIFFINITWIVLSILLSFYEVYRFTKIAKILSLLTKQIFLLILITVTYFYLSESKIAANTIINFSWILYVVLIIWRIALFYIFREYRLLTGANYKKVIVIGANESTQHLQHFFNTRPEYGYKLLGFFSNSNAKDKMGDVEDCYSFALQAELDEIYCSVNELTNTQVKKLIEFCDVNVIALRFIPDNKELYAKKLHLNYYDLTPILSLRKIPLEDPLNSWIKRVFDIVFALFVIVFVLSWLTPILGILIKLESRGPIFFRQNRPGIKEIGFGCYKFRSMGVNARTEDSATKNDPRVTKIGKFIRRTSIDELPQFFNVLFGSMSVVGPRPHLWKQNEMYGNRISKYMVRYFVKPGITGLAQVRGYRGEIQTKKDIINRTKYDIFYIENWSLLLDFNIIIQTVLNVFTGEENAY